MEKFNDIITFIEPVVKRFITKTCNKFNLDFNDLYSQYLLLAYKEYSSLVQAGRKINKKVFLDLIINRLKRYIKTSLQYNNKIILSDYIENRHGIQDDIESLILLKFDLSKVLLPIEYKIVYLKYIYGYTEREISKILKTSKSTIDRHLSRAKAKIKKYLKE